MTERLGASFRDPCGFLFRRDGVLYRQVNPAGADAYDALMASGLVRRLWEHNLLIPHDEVDAEPFVAPCHRVLRPEALPFVSYPYEWGFAQLKQAALATLHIQQRALEVGLTLKDASAYNIQFLRGGPVLIDTLSFERLREGEPWTAYRQFCQHFLAPLALMSSRDVRLGGLLRTHLDGIPLDLAARLLPRRSKLNPGLALHLHAHAATQRRYQRGGVPRKRAIDRKGLRGLVDSLDATIRRLRIKTQGTEWGDYYADTNYSADALDHKSELVGDFVARCQADTVWDLGANDGRFSRVAAPHAGFVLSADLDPIAVDTNYRRVREEGSQNIHPLLLDLTNPSPAQGFGHRERMSLQERGPADCVLALALIHHLALSNHVPLDRLAAWLRSLGNWLILEWVPKEDSQVQRLLATREDIFGDYRRDAMESSFGAHFEIVDAVDIRGSQRRLYRMRWR